MLFIGFPLAEFKDIVAVLGAGAVRNLKMTALKPTFDSREPDSRSAGKEDMYMGSTTFPDFV